MIQENNQPMFKVLVADPIDNAGLSILKKFALIHIYTKHTEEELMMCIHDYDALIVRSSTYVSSKIIKNATNLKIIGRAGVGVDNIDVQTATQAGVYVVCSPLGNTIAAAEHTLALMLTLSRNITNANNSIREGKWERSKFIGIQLQHKILGIIGLGQVGSHVAQVAIAMQMTVLCYDPYVNKEKCNSLGCQLCTLDELLRESDYISLHVPLVEKTKHLICKKTIKLMKPSVRIINASRGGVINEDDLCDALENGDIGGAALDVFEVERAFPADSRLLKAPNLLLTPHLGASTYEAQMNVAIDVCEQIYSLYKQQIPIYAVNIPGISSRELKQFHPTLRCCENFGKICAQLLSGPVEVITVKLSGKSYAKERGDLFLSSVAHGVLSYFSSTRVNYVNVKQKASENKINLNVSHDNPDEHDAIDVCIHNKTHSAKIVGYPVDQNNFILKQFQNTSVYMQISCNPNDQPVYIFYSKHKDLPGTLGMIASNLGKFDINIKNCYLGECVENDKIIGMCVFFISELLKDDQLMYLSSQEDIYECAQCTI